MSRIIETSRSASDLSNVVSWLNDAGETVPAYGVVEMTAISSGIMTAGKPSGTAGLFYTNGHITVADGVHGESRLWSTPQRVKCSEAGLFVGDVVGPTAGSWEMSTSGTGFVIMVPPSSGVAIVERIGGSGAAAASDCCCGCTCIDEGDIEVDGLETTSRWAVRLNEIREVQANGSLVLPAGDYYLNWSAGDGYWVDDVSAAMTAQYTSGNDATGDVTMTGTLILRKDDGGYTTLKLTFTGTVPAE